MNDARLPLRHRGGAGACLALLAAEDVDTGMIAYEPRDKESSKNLLATLVEHLIRTSAPTQVGVY